MFLDSDDDNDDDNDAGPRRRGGVAAAEIEYPVPRRTGASAGWSGWTPELDARLRALWADGTTTPAIGAALGCGKNAAVGRIHRLGLPARPSPVRKAPCGRPAIDLVREGLANGLTQQEIAKRSGLTRQTVARRVERIQGDPTAAQVRPVATLPALPSAADVVTCPLPVGSQSPRPAEPITQAEPAAQALTFKPRRLSACCWPIGEPGTRTFRFCDDPSYPGRPYCVEHCETAYVGFRRSDAA